jgi:hypothetical protein
LSESLGGEFFLYFEPKIMVEVVSPPQFTQMVAKLNLVLLQLVVTVV